MTAASSTSPGDLREHLPPALRGLSEDDLLELDRLARLKAWSRATDRQVFGEKELRLLARARREASPAYVKQLKIKLERARLWEQLRWYLFGGMVDLTGFPRDPRHAWDPHTNPWVQLRVPGFAMTMDEHDEADPYKLLPDKDYLRLLAYTWVHRPLLALPKSRQMMVTWLFCCIASHRVMFGRAQRLAFLSKKEEDADALLERVKVVCEQLPAEYVLPKVAKKYTHLSVPETGSHMHAMGEVAKGLRSFTFSWIFLDEAAFHDQFEPAVEAGLAAVKGGSSRLTLVSTSNGDDRFHDIVTQSGRVPAPAGP